MIKGLYRSGSAMVPRIKQQETIANNLANVSTPGYKKDMLFTRELTRAQIKKAPRQTDWQTPMIDQIYTQHSQGTLDKTGNPLDLALEGTGFMMLETPEGENLLTRAGNFTVDPQGFLTTADGNRLLGEGGSINVGNGTVSISEAGQVEVDNDIVGTIRVVEVENRNQLRKTGRSAFNIPDGIQPSAAVNFAIRQGYLETSNVDIVKEMVEMIVSFRNYEADAKSLQTQD
ncbi:MAG: flagellar basal-body rod protein FlgF, partial [candidate division Zixibacteria bacterium]|nr:flagellar basal-body rod protein FlgF [candidate division Zixibacteria bacterium]